MGRPRGRPKKTTQTAPEKKVEVKDNSDISRDNAEDDLRFLQSREPEITLDPSSTSARIERLTKKVGDVAFFSRYKNDEILLEPSVPLQVGANKWVMQPPRWIRFLDRVYTTGDKAIIEFLRKHSRYGIELLEFGKPEHVQRIKLYDDSGRMKNLERLDRLGKASKQRWAQGVDDG